MPTEKKENKEKMRYLLGESMGGAMVLLLHRKMPDYWDGAVLAAPMCKVMYFLFCSDDWVVASGSQCSHTFLIIWVICVCGCVDFCGVYSCVFGVY